MEMPTDHQVERLDRLLEYWPEAGWKKRKEGRGVSGSLIPQKGGTCLERACRVREESHRWSPSLTLRSFSFEADLLVNRAIAQALLFFPLRWRFLLLNGNVSSDLTGPHCTI